MCLQHQPLSLLNVEIATILRTILNIKAILIIFFSSFCCCSWFLLFIILLLFFVFNVVLRSLLFNAIPQRSVDYCQVFTPILYFQPAHHRMIRDTFIFNPFEIFSQFYREFYERYGFEWAFFIHRCFLPSAPSRTFYLRLSRPPCEPAVPPWNLPGFILILKHRPGPSVCLIHSNPPSL